MLKIFVSSTALDLKAHRNAVRDVLMRLHMHPVMMEDFNATDAEAVAKCQNEVLDCDVFLGIYAHRYGYIPATYQQSITELEYVWAAEQKIPRLIFMVDPRHPWDEAMKDQDPVQIGLLSAFKQRLDTEKVRAIFTTPDDLASKVVTSLAEMEREGKIKPRQRRQQRILLFGLVVLMMIAIGIAVGFNQFLTNRSANQEATREAQASQTAAAFTPTPTPLPTFPPGASFNVAIAEFTVEAGTDISLQDARSLSDAFYSNFVARIDAINGELSRRGGTIGVSGPALVGSVAGDDPIAREQTAQQVITRVREVQNGRVDLLVYGIIRQNGNQVEVIPSFYNAYASPELLELRGRFDLEAALGSPGELLIPGLTAQLTDRAQTLALIAQGIVLTVVSPPQYQRARETYAEALQIGDATQSGSELLHVLMGNASMSAYNQLAAEGDPQDLPERITLLDEIQQDFETAVRLNPQYARGYAGLGALLYQRAVLLAAQNGEDWSAIPSEVLTEIAETWQQAAAAGDAPLTADIPTKVDFGLGQVALLNYLAGDASQAEVALAAFERVIAEYDTPNERVREFAAQAYGFVGLIHSRQNQSDAALAAYDNAIELTQLVARRELFERSRHYVVIDTYRAAGDIDNALAEIATLIPTINNPSELGTVYFQQGKMLSEAGRTEDALAAFEAGTQVAGQSDVVAARLWVEVGNKRYELDDLAGSLEAFERAQELDPEGQQYLDSVMDTLRQELSSTP